MIENSFSENFNGMFLHDGIRDNKGGFRPRPFMNSNGYATKNMLGMVVAYENCNSNLINKSIVDS